MRPTGPPLGLLLATTSKVVGRAFNDTLADCRPRPPQPPAAGSDQLQPKSADGDQQWGRGDTAAPARPTPTERRQELRL